MSKKVEESLKILHGYEIVIQRKCISFEDNQEFTRTEYSNTMDTIINSWPLDKYPSFKSPIEIKKGEVAFIVWVEYTSGHTFGKSIRGYTEILGIFDKDNYKAATELANAIKGYNTCDLFDKKTSMIKVNTSDNQSFNLYANWDGYFERLEEVHITPVIRGV